MASWVHSVEDFGNYAADIYTLTGGSSTDRHTKMVFLSTTDPKVIIGGGLYVTSSTTGNLPSTVSVPLEELGFIYERSLDLGFSEGALRHGGGIYHKSLPTNMHRVFNTRRMKSRIINILSSINYDFTWDVCVKKTRHRPRGNKCKQKNSGRKVGILTEQNGTMKITVDSSNNTPRITVNFLEKVNPIDHSYDINGMTRVINLFHIDDLNSNFVNFIFFDDSSKKIMNDITFDRSGSFHSPILEFDRMRSSFDGLNIPNLNPELTEEFKNILTDEKLRREEEKNNALRNNNTSINNKRRIVTDKSNIISEKERTIRRLESELNSTSTTSTVNERKYNKYLEHKREEHQRIRDYITDQTNKRNKVFKKNTELGDISNTNTFGEIMTINAETVSATNPFLGHYPEFSMNYLLRSEHSGIYYIYNLTEQMLIQSDLTSFVGDIGNDKEEIYEVSNVDHTFFRRIRNFQESTYSNRISDTSVKEKIKKFINDFGNSADFTNVKKMVDILSNTSSKYSCILEIKHDKSTGITHQKIMTIPFMETFVRTIRSNRDPNRNSGSINANDIVLPNTTEEVVVMPEMTWDVFDGYNYTFTEWDDKGLTFDNWEEYRGQ